jgi:sRNA-binding carbon storage regulator CsrA
MLALARRKNEGILIGFGDIAVTVLNFITDRVVLQVDYPAELLLKGGGQRGPALRVGPAEETAGPPRLRATIVLKPEESVCIGEGVAVKVLSPPKRSSVKLGIQAPREMPIMRAELQREGPPPV